MNIPPPPPHV
ncbi:unnamed protein product [Lactuca saligna]|uniref:Uncharacterized protein n=1 Tax=Lactuca saligna TaxID=75948 RepID=A0AA36E2Q5_LACSI|nr:unnamed protein product [Lactuca saligna]